MKLAAITASIILVFSSCLSYKVIPLKGTYSDGNFEALSDKPKDSVWDNIIEFFAKNGISIRIIDRSSGLIISGGTQLTWTYENSKGEPVNKEAWVVIAKIIDLGTKKAVKPYTISGEWNIRIKEQNGHTLINVNLVNPYYYSSVIDKNSTLFKKGSIQSTEKFENFIYEKIK